MSEAMAESQKLPVAIEDEMRRSYLDYAMSVIIGRAIPDARDGLKPVHRRILYSMHEQKVSATGSYKKSARIVGDVLGKYHPHGDTAVYDALVRMAQDFAMRVPLVDGQGNFGSVDGDRAAAMRYTEVRMARVAAELLADIEKDTVEFGPNFDDSESEPLVLPSRIPNLLVNGSGGIAVGMATNIPPHNLGEVIDATIRIIKRPDISLAELIVDDPETGRTGVKGPDFPTGGFIYGTAGIHKAYASGRGRVVMRARATIEDMPGKSNREQIIVTELPYQVNKAELLKKIAELVREKRLEGISDLRDESDRDGMRMVIELKRDAHGEVVLNSLYRMTALQSTFGYNCLAIVGKRPQLLGLKETLVHFINHRRDVVTRRSNYELREAEGQREIIEGLGMAITEVDVVIKTIRESSDPNEAKTKLRALPLKGLEAFVKRAGRPEAELAEARKRGDYFLSERQAKAILEMRLSRLTGLEREKLASEYASLCDTIARLRAILGSEELLMEVIVNELDDAKAKHADARRTEILEAEGEISVEDLVPDEEVVVTISQKGYIKRVPLAEYRAQGRGGRGRRAMSTKDEDFIQSVFSVNAHAHLLFLTDTGRIFLKRAYQIPQKTISGAGRAVVNFVGFNDDEKLAAVVPVREFYHDGYLVTCTKGGRVKRTELSKYENVRQTGIIGVGIDEGDALLTARLARDNQSIVIGTSAGNCIRFAVDDARPMGRGSKGVKGIDLRPGDVVVGMDVVDEGSDAQVLTICENGYGKRTPLETVGEDGELVGERSFKIQRRGGKGVVGIQTSERNGPMVKLRLVSADDDLMVITDGGQVIRTRVAEISELNRNTQGVRVIRLNDGEKVVDVEPVLDEERASLFPPPPDDVASANSSDNVEANDGAEASAGDDSHTAGGSGTRDFGD